MNNNSVRLSDSKIIMIVQNILEETLSKGQGYSKQACYSQEEYLERICCIVWDNLATALDVGYF